jgi:RimJ/RimL family protein N-acetyltransferase
VTRWFQIKHIDLDTHKKWMDSLKVPKPRSIAFFIEYENKFVGVTYFHFIDYAVLQADFGIYIYDVTMRGKGIGTCALKKALEYADKHMGMKKIFLDVVSDNIAAQNVYGNAGFRMIGEKPGKVKRYLYEMERFSLKTPGHAARIWGLDNTNSCSETVAR